MQLHRDRRCRMKASFFLRVGMCRKPAGEGIAVVAANRRLHCRHLCWSKAKAVCAVRSAQCAVISSTRLAHALALLPLLQAPLGLRDRSSNAPCFEVIQRFLGTERVSVALGFLSPQSSRLVPLLVCSLLASRPTIVFPCHSGQRHASVANGCPPEG